MTDGFATWGDVLAAATVDPPPPSASRLLSAVCIAGLSFVTSSIKKSTDDFPSGSPPKAIVRSAAESLCELTRNAEDELSRSRHTLGLISLLYQAQRTADSNEYVRKIALCERAVAMVSHSDSLAAAICQNTLGGALRSANRPADAVSAYRQSLRLLAAVDLFSTAHWMYEDAPFLRVNAKPGAAYKVTFRARLGVVRALLAMLDVASARSEVELLVRFVETHRDRDLKPLGWALVTRARVQRASNDTKSFLATEAELQVLAAGGVEDGPLHRYWLTCAADNASHLKDFGRVEWATRQRLAARARRILGIDLDPANAGADDFRNLVDRAHAVGSRNSLTNIGNGCYDIVKAQLFSGALNDAPERRVEALRVLDVVDYAWANFKGNGTQSLLMMRGLIRLLDDHPPRDDVTRELVSVNSAATNENTARNALVAAVRLGVVGSSVVRARLDELLASTDPVRAAGEFAVLTGLSAEWWFRVNDAGGSPEQAADWAVGEAVALDAVRLLRPAGVSLDPELEATCWHGAALALTAGDGREIEQLERLLWSVRCVAELMVTVSTNADRARLSTRFAPVFAGAAALAVELGDHDAADVVMEAARRDRIGLILAELARNPEVDTAIRSAALAVSDSSATTPPTVDTSSEDGEDGSATSTSTEERSAAILVDRQGAVSDAERVLGPLGALCDTSSLMSITAASVLTRRADPATTTAVLQLFAQRNGAHVGDGADRSATEVRVYRRLTWTGGEDTTVEEHLDSVDVPEDLLTLTAPQTFTWSSSFASAVLPPPLLDLLRRDSCSPVRLMIVPTGFFHVPFDALPLSAAGVRGDMVLDRAVVSVHGSLTSMLALMQIDTASAISPSIAVYDVARADGELKHVKAEFESLNTHVPGVVPVQGAAELQRLLRNRDDAEPIAMLAMGVHGSEDDQGWGQGKEMPDGSTVTAAQALGWTVPRLCVLASCHSPITTADGVELGGFPLSLMLRGAVTVIGGLYGIDDEATTDIMDRFWKLYAEGNPPLTALHQAKLTWLQDKPQVRRLPRLWAGLVTYGAATQ